MDKNRQKFIKWIREEINPQATPNGNSVVLDDFSKDGTKEYPYPKNFAVCGDKYYWDISSAHTKGRCLTTHYEIWFHGKAFGGSQRIATGELTLSKIRKGLKSIFDYYISTGMIKV